MSDPLSHVASWLTPTTPAEAADPVIALIAEVARLEALWSEADARGDEIFLTLPEDIRERRVQVSFQQFGELLDGRFASEVAIHQSVDVHRPIRGMMVRRDARQRGLSAAAVDAAAAEAIAEFDQDIGLAQALARFRAGLEEIEAIREASGCEAHYREANAIGEQIQAILVELRQTKPVTLAGAIAMLELGLSCGGVDEGLTNTALAGLRDMQPGSAA